MTWRVAKALLTLRNEVDKEFPRPRPRLGRHDR